MKSSNTIDSRIDADDGLGNPPLYPAATSLSVGMTAHVPDMVTVTLSIFASINH